MLRGTGCKALSALATLFVSLTAVKCLRNSMLVFYFATCYVQFLEAHASKIYLFIYKIELDVFHFTTNITYH